MVFEFVDEVLNEALFFEVQVGDHLTHGAAAGEDAPEGILVVGVAVIEPARQVVEAIEAEMFFTVGKECATSSAEAWIEEPKQVIP